MFVLEQHVNPMPGSQPAIVRVPEGVVVVVVVVVPSVPIIPGFGLHWPWRSLQPQRSWSQPLGIGPQGGLNGTCREFCFPSDRGHGRASLEEQRSSEPGFAVFDLFLAGFKPFFSGGAWVEDESQGPAPPWPRLFECLCLLRCLGYCCGFCSWLWP